MAISLPVVGTVINTRLLSEPMNYVTVFIVATLWLLLFHVIMQAFGAMQSNGMTAIGAGPGQVSAPSANAPANFAQPGVLAGGAAQLPGLFVGGATQIWTDDSEAKYAEDGWYGNS